MTIESEITRIQNNIAAAYTAASGKGATLPATENSDNLATCIGSIPSGGTSPTGLKVNVTFQNGASWKYVDSIEIQYDSQALNLATGDNTGFNSVTLNVPANSTLTYTTSTNVKDVSIYPESGSITLQGSYAELNFVVSWD